MVVRLFVVVFLVCDVSRYTTAASVSHSAIQSTTDTTNASTVTTHPTNASKTKCYPFVGCFDNRPPFDNAGLDLPNSPARVGTVMLLFTPEGGSKPEVLDYTNENTVLHSHYDPARTTKFIIHGFTNTINTTWIYEMKDELLKNEPMNVVVVAWGPGAAAPNYNQAVANTRLVGTQVRLMIDQMVLTGAKLTDFHLIGHSLGAHASGYTGYLLRGKLSRITGCDPAKPGFEAGPARVRLNPSNAMFVDIIHTNGAPLFQGGAGLLEQSGHVDFYVNGGESQLGCPNQFSKTLSNIGHLNIGHLGADISCSHMRSHVYFTESINTPCPFTAFPCHSNADYNNGSCLSCGTTGCSQLGYYADRYSGRGKLYLNTDATNPFCGFQYAVKVVAMANSSGTVAVRLNGDWGTSGWHAVTDPDVYLISGTVLRKVIASPTEVGELHSISIRYSKYTGIGGFGVNAGTDTWSAESVSVTSAELGESFLFCVKNHLLHDSVGVSVKRTTAQSC